MNRFLTVLLIAGIVIVVGTCLLVNMSILLRLFLGL